jgi:phosphopantothenoylcysteine decarboxylase/phosphopantothenate--cysteine ligase
LRVLITAGPTREPLDPVRFLSNYSTGAMGFAIATEALARGHEPVLVLGPVERQPPVDIEVYGVETAREMLDAVLDFLPDCGAVICSAAVCDYRPAKRSENKIKRGSLRSIELVENPDIAAEVGRRRAAGVRFAVFALETDDGAAHARDKLKRKGADLCVLNSPAAIGSESAEFRLIRADGGVRELGEVAKSELARALLDDLGL